MFVRTRRRVGSLCLALLALNVVACSQIKRQGAQSVIPAGGDSVRLDNVVGVVLKDGREMRFEASSRTVVIEDSLRVVVGKQPQAIPVSEIRDVWVRSINKKRTTLLVLGLTLPVLYYLAVSAISQSIGDVYGGGSVPLRF